MDANGVLSGTPQTAGTLEFTVTVTDSAGKTASKGFTLVVRVAPLRITSGPTLPGGTLGSPYSASFSATGGIPPYTWSSGGELPAGLSVSASGNVSGTPTTGGSFSFTVTVRDTQGTTASQEVSGSIAAPPAPPVNVTGFTPTANPQQQPTIGLTTSAPYPVDITGTMTLTFAPMTGGDDPAVRFSTGGRSVNFSIPANTTNAVFPVPDMAYQTGTVAGTITFSITLQAGGQSVTPAPAPWTVRINAGPPVITRVRLTRNASSIDVEVTGYATSRSVTQATFRFAAATGGNLQTSELAVPAGTMFSTWYQNAASAAFGSQFTFVQTFNVQGRVSDIGSVTVILTNDLGSSPGVSAQ